jgi:hypothetical protein
MKRFALLRLCHNSNKVVMDTVAADVKGAVKKFNPCLVNMPPLDEDGYAKGDDGVSYCVAEYFSPFHTI